MAQQTNTTHKLTNKVLSIQIGLNGLSFCILNTESNTITTLKTLTFDVAKNPFDLLDTVKHLFNTEEVLQQEFNKVTVIHKNELSTLVPKALFNEAHLADYLKFNSKILQSDFITFDELNINDSINVYVPYVNINNFIYDTFGSFTFKHHSTILLEHILSLDKNSTTPKMYANINNNTFEIIVTNEGKLQFYNTFEYTTKEDFIYYILFTAEQLNLNPETFNLILLGDIEKDDELYTIAYKYIRHLSFGNRFDNYNYSTNTKSPFSNYALIKSL